MFFSDNHDSEYITELNVLFAPSVIKGYNRIVNNVRKDLKQEGEDILTYQLARHFGATARTALYAELYYKLLKTMEEEELDASQKIGLIHLTRLVEDLKVEIISKDPDLARFIAKDIEETIMYGVSQEDKLGELLMIDEDSFVELASIQSSLARVGVPIINGLYQHYLDPDRFIDVNKLEWVGIESLIKIFSFLDYTSDLFEEVDKGAKSLMNDTIKRLRDKEYKKGQKLITTITLQQEHTDELSSLLDWFYKVS